MPIYQYDDPTFNCKCGKTVPLSLFIDDSIWDQCNNKIDVYRCLYCHEIMIIKWYCLQDTER